MQYSLIKMKELLSFYMWWRKKWKLVLFHCIHSIHIVRFSKKEREKNYIANPAIEFSIELYVLFLHNPLIENNFIDVETKTD